MRDPTDDQIDELSDAELLVRARRRSGNPYLPLSMAKKMRFQEAKWRHLGAEVQQRQRAEREAEQRRLDALVRRPEPDSS